jgi:hypothetical protein
MADAVLNGQPKRVPGSLKYSRCYRAGVPNLGEVRDLKSVISWYICIWEIQLDVGGDADIKRLEAPVIVIHY